MPEKRRLLAGPMRCRFRCQYCFAKSGHYPRQPTYDSRQTYSEFDIIYPACDTELLLEPEWKAKLQHLAGRAGRCTIIRFSTKSVITEEIADDLSAINHSLLHDSKGFLLVGISISTRSRLEEIEPGTANFQQRIAGLGFLASRGIPINVTFRPLLPFIPAAEYSEIAQQTREFTRDYLLGGLYVFKGTPFYDLHIADKHSVISRQVDWLDAKPEWEFIKSADLTQRVAEELSAAGCRPYHSDLELVSHIRTTIALPTLGCVAC